MSLATLTRLSRRFGGDKDYVLAGGGNSSFKDNSFLYIKPSGVSMADIVEKNFVKLDRAKIEKVFEIDYSDDPVVREDKVKLMMGLCVVPGTEGRPSVEAPLHHCISYRYVLHLHPARVNGMTCGRNGKILCSKLFPDSLWIDFMDPGYVLSVRAMEEIGKFEKSRGYCPKMIFLKNHGVFVGADTSAEIEDIYSHVMGTLEAFYKESRVPISLFKDQVDKDCVMELAPMLRSLLAKGADRRIMVSEGSFKVAPGPLSPDHIVHAGAHALECTNPGQVGKKLTKFRADNGCNPTVISVPGKAVLVSGDTYKDAMTSLGLAKDAALVLQLTKAFGGPVFLSEKARKFIENWEVESYRKKNASACIEGPLRSKVAVVTGGAQGFGLGIAKGLVEEGATVAIADLNFKGAAKAAKEINSKYGDMKAVPLEVNISDENSVRDMVKQAVMAFGGIDIFVANAGVLKAGSVKSFTRMDWDFVTDVNYTGYFLCVKHVAAVMSRQNACGGDWTDIVQINSKSGLVGSNRNAAYAASKFGTIGQTQSFALELVEDRIKVNSICPGNYFEGPLWSDPEKGLFVQYLKSKKVPGAKNIQDVRRFYESKIPMARGCLPEDVVRAIVYCVTQKYETGQAIAVTGGQVLLH
ncbi:MAG: SDR family NAD(P)-dependent oxidoreductase [Victivallales bacterium]|nr:SDR family NAD(P)-dependent oxidoreductase [Victivallales bacterium]